MSRQLSGGVHLASPRSPAITPARPEKSSAGRATGRGIWTCALTIFVLAAGVRAVAVEVMLRGVPERRLPDSELYEAYAQALLDEGRFVLGEDGCRRTPGYPLFVAGIHAGTGSRSERPVLHVQAVLSGGVAAMVAWMAGRIAPLPTVFGMPASGMAAGALSTFDVYSVATAGTLLSETLFTFQLTAVILLLSRVPPFPRFPFVMGLVVGVLFGSATLVRPSGLLMLPLGILAVGALRLRAFSNSLDHHAIRLTPLFVAIALGFVLVMSPWWVRNANRYGRFVPTTLNVGESLYDGVRPGADGGSDMAFAEDPVVRKLSEVERDHHWRELAFRVLRNEPARVIALIPIKVFRFWSPWPNHADFRRLLAIVAGTAVTLPTLLLAVCGVIALAGRGDRGRLLLFLGPAVYFTVLHALFVSSVRYRVPVMPGICVLAGIGLLHLLSSSARPHGSTAPAFGRTDGLNRDQGN